MADWLADSAVKTVTYHRTSPAAARAIVEHSVSIERSRIGSYGQGFYSATKADEFYGDAEITVAICTRSPFVGDMSSVSESIDRLARHFSPTRRITPHVSMLIRRELLAAGYDAIVVRDAGGDGIDYVVALDERIVRVVAT